MSSCPNCGSENVVTVPAKMVGGAATGGLIGSVVPVIGTGLGAIIGGVAGAVASAASDSNGYVRFCSNCKKSVSIDKD